MEKVPADDKCEECWSLRQRGFSFLPWDALCRLNQEDTQFSAGVDEARKVSQGEVKNFFEAAVSRDDVVGYRISRFARVLSAREFKDETSFDLTKVSVQQHTTTMLIEGSASGSKGSTELVAVVSDPERPHRYIEVFSEHFNRMQENRMTQEGHLFKDQGRLTYNYCASEHKSSAGMHILSNRLLSGEELKAKLEEKISAPKKDNVLDLDVDEDGNVTEQGAVTMNPSLGKGPALINLAGSGRKKGKAASKQAAANKASAKQPPRPPASSPSREEVHDRKGSEGLGDASEGDATAGTCKKHRIESAEATDSGEDEDKAESRAGSVVGSTGFDFEESADENAAWWIAKLPPTAVLQGQKLGREERHAANWLAKKMVSGNNAGATLAGNELKDHLRLIAICKQCTAENIPVLTDDELKTFLALLRAAKVVFPPCVKLALFKRRCAVLLMQCEKGDAAAFKTLAAILEPPFQESPKEFCVLEPTLAGLAGSPADSAKLFNKIVFQQVLMPNIGKGAQASLLVLKFCQAVDAMAQSAAEHVTGLWNHVIYDTIVATSSLKGMLAEGLEMGSVEKEMVELFEADKKKGAGTVLHEVSKRIGQCEFYSKAKVLYFEKAAALKHCGPIIQSAEEFQPTDDCHADVLQLKEIVRSLSELQTSFASRDIKKTLDKGMADIKLVVEQALSEAFVEGDGSSRPKTVDRLESDRDLLTETSQLLVFAADAFPMAAAIDTWRKAVRASLEKSKAMTVTASLTKLLTAFPGRGSLTWESWLLELRKETKVKHNAQQLPHDICAYVLDKLLTQALDTKTWKEAEECLDAAAMVCDVAWSDGRKEIGKEVVRLVTYDRRLHADLGFYLDQASNCAERVDADPDRRHIFALMRSLEICEAAGFAATVDHFLKSVMEVVQETSKANVAKATVVVKETIDLIVSESLGVTRAACEQLKNIVGGQPDGRMWFEGLRANASYDEVETHAKAGLLLGDGPQAVKFAKQLSEAL